MDKIFITLILIGVTMAISPTLNAQSCGVILGDRIDECSTEAIEFYPECQDLLNPTYQWFTRREGSNWVDAGYDPSFLFSVVRPAGTYYVSLVVRDAELDFVKSFEPRVVIIDNRPAIVRPQITIDKAIICRGQSVTLSVTNVQAGVTYSWASEPLGFSADGTIVTFNNVMQSTQFNVQAHMGGCTEGQSTDVFVLTSGTIVLDPSMNYHKRILTREGNSGYLQTSPTETSTEINLGSYAITEPNTFYLRTYHASNNCWAEASPAMSVTEFNYVPPTPLINQVYHIGYNSMFMANDDKAFLLRYADFYWVDGYNSTTILQTYADGDKISESGTYYVRGRDKGTGTWSPTLTIQVQQFGDDGFNWVHSKSFDGTSATVPFAESKSYFDEAGKALQVQTKIHTENKGDFIFASQNLRDKCDRVVGSTLSAPIKSKNFKYHSLFLLNESGDIYSATDFDVKGSTLYQPITVGQSNIGSVGWYYSANNTLETKVPKTSYPYSRTEFYDDGTGEVKRSAGPGDQHRLGKGHEVLSGTFPVYNELDDYLDMRVDRVGIQDNITSLKNTGVQSVVHDQNGKYAISISDKSGKTVMSARKGTQQDYVLAVATVVSASTDHMVYFYLLEASPVSIGRQDGTGYSYTVQNIITNEVAQDFSDANNGNKWPAGFYRVLVSYGVVDITYTNYYLDVSYQFYDDAGRLKSSLSPNGFKQLKTNSTVPFADIDKTTYQYNHQGWLLSMTEPDAGQTNYKYRSDGKIRFSQNAQQLCNETPACPTKSGEGKFSYTNYDALGRPYESGEYKGAQAFSATASQVEIGTQIEYSDKKDWVRTYYDVADADFQSRTGLPSSYVQDFVRGGVSHTENANMHTWYSYDELGRVTWMAQRPTALPRVFVVKYNYDFLGNVLTVSNLAFDTSGHLLDQFYHHYEYDKDKRLSKAYTSVTESSDKKQRAHYEYYLHGPLKRIVLGDKLQGLDFVYNINGWLTQINHPNTQDDPGHDGESSNGVKKDVFGMVLDYYESDLSNLLVADASGSIHNPMRRHHLPAELSEAYAVHQPLIRFASPAQLTQENINTPSFKEYSVQNPRYKKMLEETESMVNSD